MSNSSNSYHSIARRILQNNGPMRFSNLVKEILKEKTSQGKTPENTIFTTLNRSKYIKRDNHGIYSLKSEN